MRNTATVTVHWPGKTVVMCDEHAEHARRAAEAMGFALAVTRLPWPSWVSCAVCVKQRERVAA